MPSLSLVIPIYNEQANINPLVEAILIYIQKLGLTDYEIILIDDGSTDNSRDYIYSHAHGSDHIGGLQFSKNFGYESAVLAGLEYSSKDWIMIMDADFQDPPSLIYDLYTHAVSGKYDVVLAQRASRSDGWFKDCTAWAFYRTINFLSDVSIPRDVGYCRICSRAVINAVLQCKEHNRFLKGLFAYIGFRTTSISYIRPPRAAGETSFTFSSLIKLVSHAVFSFSTVPLRLMMVVGLLCAGCSFIVGCIQIFLKFTQTTQLTGVSTSIVLISFLGGIQLLGLGIVGEYIGRIYDEVKNRPLYITRIVV